MYAMVCLQPDIAYVTCLLGRYLQNPGMVHFRAAKKILRYLKGTRDHLLTYRRGTKLEMIGYSDSDFTGCRDTAKSTSAYIFTFAGGAVSWRSSRQDITVDSTMYAESIACYEAAKHARWLKTLVGEMEIVESISRPLTVFCDNEAAIQHIRNNKITKRNKHHDVKYRMTGEYVEQKIIDVQYISTTCMLADPLTKALRPAEFQAHAENMGVVAYWV